MPAAASTDFDDFNRFIAGVWPLVASHGAGAEMRHAMGIATFSGMIGVTLFGLLLTPIFYVLVSKLGGKRALAFVHIVNRESGNWSPNLSASNRE